MIDAGAAWFSLGSGPTAGRVCAVFREAAYLRIGDHVLAVGSGAIPSGPLHLRTARFSSIALAVGDPVALRGGRLQVPRLEVELREERRWLPPAVDGHALRARTGWVPGGLVTAPGLPAACLAAAVRSASVGDLEAAAALLGGRGPGLTPAGDDVLAGILVVDALLRPEGQAERRSLVGRVRTTDVAGAFLRWAAMGQSIRPTHDLLAAVAAGHPRAEAAARAELIGMGASSGAAMLRGMQIGLA
ncbi:MAG: DUF2877 domain-containing protein [Actinomycetota bacterium]|nr:DUF2877 domain-containing protein [Actinomycetota bacterium]